MTFTSAQFIIFVIISYLIFKFTKFKWQALLAFSVFYYASYSIKAFSYLALTILTTYFSALYLEKNKNPWLLFLCLLINFSSLFFVKFTDFTLFENLIPLGISFYIFISTAYLIDVYRKKYPANKNLLKYTLFVSYFPQMVQGPINRYDSLGPQLFDPKPNSGDFSYGLMLMAYGYFKKLVIADRASVLTAQIFSNPDEFSGLFVFIAIIFYSIQIYGDFSGGIDIARGVSYLFGIKLDLNFKRPFFATSLTDFWRRWHISLGSWMRDYVFYPMSLSKVFAHINKKSRKVLGRKYGKFLTLTISTFVVYFIIGIWHGAGLNFMAFGIFNGSLISLGLIFEDFLKKIKSSLNISKDSKSFKVFQILRTSLLVFFARYFTRSKDLETALFMLKKTFADRIFRYGEFGLERIDYTVLFISVLLLFIISFKEERGEDVKEEILSLSPISQGILIFMVLAFILYFGIFQRSFTGAEFIYRNY
ncbi:MBOAT family O-acyltransferase [Peptoniphilus raoultii]|uniref:MBOAT family O-acyltransferase n=1 Tax=Peptoniphilus raoultii TaxID=1776387 RepID=UPI0008DB143D|nr:MBOAT family O-acyltransferase [Peptoniphilus raoultii]